MQNQNSKLTKFIFLVFFTVTLGLDFGCARTKQLYSKGTPSVPQGPSVTIQEEHDLRDADKFKRFTEHMLVESNMQQKEIPKFQVNLLAFEVEKTKKLVTNLRLNLEIVSHDIEGVYFYDLIFDGINVQGVSPNKRKIIDKQTDHFYLGPGQSQRLTLALQLPWFQSPKPQKIHRQGNEILIQSVVSKKNIDVDEFFKEAGKAHNLMGLPPHLQTLHLIPKKLLIKG